MIMRQIRTALAGLFDMVVVVVNVLAFVKRSVVVSLGRLWKIVNQVWFLTKKRGESFVCSAFSHTLLIGQVLEKTFSDHQTVLETRSFTRLLSPTADHQVISAVKKINHSQKPNTQNVKFQNKKIRIKMTRKWPRNDHKMTRVWPENNNELTKRPPNDQSMARKWPWNDQKTTTKWPGNDNGLSRKWPESDQKMTTNWPKDHQMTRKWPNHQEMTTKYVLDFLIWKTSKIKKENLNNDGTYHSLLGIPKNLREFEEGIFSGLHVDRYAGEWSGIVQGVSSVLDDVHHLIVGQGRIRRLPERHNLPHNHAERPDIRFWRVNVVVQRLRGHPLHREHAVLLGASVVALPVHLPGQTEIADFDRETAAFQAD